ncbi:MAG: DUF427 domain-containing protein [Rubripirellula sp.]|nr:DUF427 domain-containing protein [Rubripirellula sp.]
MAKAIWNDKVLAESDQTEMVDGNHYFPPNSLQQEYFQPSEATTVCGWKGTANYYDVAVDGKVNQQAAWYYAAPKQAAENIKGYVAFWKGVTVTS